MRTNLDMGLDGKRGEEDVLTVRAEERVCVIVVEHEVVQERRPCGERRLAHGAAETGAQHNGRLLRVLIMSEVCTESIPSVRAVLTDTATKRAFTGSDERGRLSGQRRNGRRQNVLMMMLWCGMVRRCCGGICIASGRGMSSSAGGDSCHDGIVR